MNAMMIMKQAAAVKSAKHYNLLRGKLEKVMASAKLSDELRESALRELRRVAKASYDKKIVATNDPSHPLILVNR